MSNNVFRYGRGHRASLGTIWALRRVSPLRPDLATWTETKATDAPFAFTVPAPTELIGTGIASEEAFGTGIVAGAITGTGIASEEAFGTGVIQQDLILAGTGIASDEAFGTGQVNFTLAGSGIPSEEAFGTGQANFTLTGTGIASEETFGSGAVEQITTLTGTGITSEEAFGTGVVSFVIVGAGIASEETFGTGIVAGAITGIGIASEETFGTGIVAGALAGIGIASEEAFGSGIVAGPIIGTGIASQEAFGSGSLSFILTAPSIASEETFGNGAVTFLQAITGTGIASEETFGNGIVDIGTIRVAVSADNTDEDGIYFGPTTGGTKVILHGVPLDLSNFEGAFTNSVYWTSVQTANAEVSDRRLSLGRGVASAITRYTNALTKMDVALTLTESRELESTASTWVGFYADSNNYVRFYTDGGTLSVVNGVTQIDIDGDAGVGLSADMRVLRNGPTIYFFRGGVELRRVTWLGTGGYFEIGTSSTTAVAKARRTTVSNFTRTPIVLFGTTPVIEPRELSRRSLQIYSPAVARPQLVHVYVTTENLTIDLGEIFEYTHPVTFQAVSDKIKIISDVTVRSSELLAS